MIISFKVSNFLSFKDEVCFSFASNSNIEEDIRTISYSKSKLNKTNVIYGANAGGKSNLLKAITFFKKMIIFSHDQTQTPGKLGYKPFLLSKNKIKESSFEMSFLLDKETYTYSFSINSSSEEIIEESLSKYTSQKPSKLYVRKGGEIKTSGGKFQEAEERKHFIRSNGLALSIFSNIGGEVSSKIREFFMTKVHIFGPQDGNHPSDTFEMIEKYGDKFKKFLMGMLNSADVNVNDMDYKIQEKTLQEIPTDHLQFLVNTPGFIQHNNTVTVVETGFIHNIYDSEGNIAEKTKFSSQEESTGTNRLINLSGSLFNVMVNGMTLFVDELDSSLHPLIVREIVKLFNSEKNTSSQIVFSSHDISLLDEDILNNDQIWFVNKNEYGISHLYSLIEFNGLSSIKSIQKAYIQGKFDGIPSTEDIDF